WSGSQNTGQQSPRGRAGQQRCRHPPTSDCRRTGPCPCPAPEQMNTAKRTEIFRRMQAANPKPTTELEYDTNFQLLIAVILSAQATDRSVNLATRKFFPEHGTPAGLLNLGEAGLADHIKTIGLYK